MAATFVPIQSVTLASSAASVTFSAIPQTYTDLVVRWSDRSSDSTNSDYITINGVGGTSYSHTRLGSNGSAASSARASNAPLIQSVATLTGSDFTANVFSSHEIYIPNYAGGAYKPASLIGTTENNVSTSYMYATAGLASITDAVTSVKIAAQSGNYVAGSTFHLYGIKNS